ncbi:MAG: UTP--glucose-phosphate uridylyltransferase, partial [Thermoanaerobacterium sp.]|nr:UTP--glucose-phosphate uridylyltransferase [Thermoanaerobacterium sp.]
GIVDANMIDDRLYRVNNLVEKPKKEEAPSNMAILGRYIISPKIFDILKDLRPGAGGEIQLTDALKVLLNYEAIYAYNFEGKRYDVGDRMGFLKATIEYALKREDLKNELLKYLNEIVKAADKNDVEVAACSENNKRK